MAADGSNNKLCELCSATAAVHCPSDSAYLCSRCDAAVHSANFLVARHLRSPLCRRCGHPSASPRFSGLGTRRDLRGSCDRCSAESSLTDSEEVSSAAVRRTGRRKRTVTVDGTGEGILVNWCRRLGLDGDSTDSVVAMAERVLRRLARAPVRVGLATSFWVGLRFSGSGALGTCQNLVRVEKITGVPAKVILALEGRLGRVVARGSQARAIRRKDGPSPNLGWCLDAQMCSFFFFRSKMKIL